MLDIGQRHNVEISIEHLSLNFDKLENMHYGLLKKFQEEKGIKHKPTHSRSPSTELTKQSSDENGFDRLQSLKTAFNQETHNLKKLLSTSFSTSRPLTDAETFKFCSDQVESSIKSLKGRILTAPELKDAGKTLNNRVNSYFELASKDISLAFSHIRPLSDKGDIGKDSMERITELCHINFETLSSVGNLASSLKKKIIAYVNELHNYEASYNKEADALRANLEQIKSQIQELGQCSNENKVQETVKAVGVLLNKSATIENETNRLFSATKNQSENTFKKIMNQLKEIIAKVDNSHSSNKAIGKQEKASEDDIMTHQIVVSPYTSLEKRNMSMQVSSALSPEYNFELFRRRNHSPSSKLLVETVAPKSSMSPSKQNFFSPISTSRKSYISGNSPQKSAKELSPKSVKEEDQLKRYVGTVKRMKEDLQECSRNLLRAVKRVIESSIDGERPNKLVLHTYKESQTSFEKLLKELEGVTYQGKFIYPFGYSSTKRSNSPENLERAVKQTFRSQSPTRKGNFGSVSAKNLSSKLNIDDNILINKKELLIWKTEERRKNLEEVYALLVDNEKSAGSNVESEQAIALAMTKIEKLLHLVEAQFERKYVALYAKLGQKENKLECLEQDLAKLLSNKELVQSSKGDRKDNGVIEGKYNALMKEYENSQSQKKKIEESYQLQIQVLNDKIIQLSELNEQREANTKLESVKLQDHSQDVLNNTKKEVEAIQAKYNVLLKEHENIQGQNKKVQESYQLQVQVLNDKIIQLSELNEQREANAKLESVKMQDHSENVISNNLKEVEAQLRLEGEEKLRKAREEFDGKLKKQTEDHNNQIKTFNAQVISLTQEKEATEKDFAEKQDKILSLTNEIDAVKDAYKAKVDTLKDDCEALKKDLEGKQSHVVVISKEMESFKALNAQLAKELAQTKSYVSTLEEAAENAEEQVNKIVVLKREKEELQAHLNTLESGIINKQAEIVQLREEYEASHAKLEEALENAKEKNKVLTEEKKKLIEGKDTKTKESLFKIEELKTELENCMEDVKSLNAEIGSLRKQNEKLLNENEQMKQAAAEQREEVIELKNKLAEARMEHGLAVSRYEEDIKEFENQNKLNSDKYESTLVQERSQIDKLNQDNLEKEKEIQIVKNQLIEKDEAHRSIVDIFEGEIATLKIRLNKLLANGEIESPNFSKNPFEPAKEVRDEIETPNLGGSEEHGQHEDQHSSAGFGHEKTAFSLANSVVSFEYQTQQGESNMFDKKAQFSAFGNNKFHLTHLENGRIEEESTPTPHSKSIHSKFNEGTALDEAEVKDSSYDAEESEARDQVGFDMERSGALNHEKTAFSLANSVVSFEYLTQQGESVIDPKKAQFSAFKFDNNASHVGQKMKEEMKALQEQIEQLKKEKAILQEEHDKFIKYKEETSSIEQMQSEIKELKAFLTQKDIEISNFKIMSSRVSFDADKARENYEKKIFDLSTEIKELKEKKVQVEKSQEVQPQQQDLGLKKLNTMDFKREFESFEFSDVNAWKQSQADFSQVSFSESQISVEKYKKDNKRLREERRHLKDENEELRASVKIFQEQIVNLSEVQKSSVQPVAKTDEIEIIKTLRESFEELCAMETLKDRLQVKLGNKKETKETFESLKRVLRENEEDMLELVKELEEYDRAHDEIEQTKERLKQREEEMSRKIAEANIILQEGRKRIQDEVDLLEGDMNERLLKTHKELEAILQDFMIADLNSENLKVDGEEGLEKTEKMIAAYLAVIREYIEVATEVQDNYEKLLAENQEKDEKNAQPNQRQSMVKKPEGEEEKKDHLDIPDTLKKPLKRGNTIEQLRKFLPRSSISESAAPVTPEGEETNLPTFQDIVDRQVHIATVNDVGNQEHVKALYDQIRALQDDNEKLQEEAKQVDHDFAMLKFVRDDLKAELLEKEEQIKVLETKLDKATTALEKNEYKAQLMMEKDHIRSIFVKFMQSAINGQKDAAFELLKMFMSLIQLPEEEQKWLIEIFKKKKKGVFSKLFK